MIVRIYWARIEQGAWPSIEEKFSELNKISTRGFRGRLVTQDVNDPESLYTITFWDDMDSVRTWEASTEYEHVFVAAIKPFIVGSQSVSFCEVRVENISGLVGSTKGATAASA